MIELKDLTTLLSGSLAMAKKYLFGRQGKTVKSLALESVAYFPVLFSDAISSDTAGLLMKSLEAEYSTYLKVALAGRHVYIDNVDNDASANRLLKDLGINTGATRESNMDLNTFLKSIDEESVIMIKKFSYNEDKWNENKDIALTESDAHFSYRSIDGIKVLTETISKYERYKRDIANKEQELKDIDDRIERRKRLGIHGNIYNLDEKQLDAAYKLKDQEINNLQKLIDTEDALEEKRILTKELEVKEQERVEETDRLTNLNDRADRAARISDKNIDKLTKLEPSLFKLSIGVIDLKTKQFVGSTEMVIGVKTIPHVIPEEEMSHYLVQSLKRKNMMFNVIRWLTGEKKFWKDLVFQIKDHKEDVFRARNSQTANIWKGMDMERSWGLIRRFTGSGELMPTATIVITEYDVQSIKKKSGMDLTKNVTASKVLDNLNAFGFIIADASIEEVSVFSKERNAWVVYPFADLDTRTEELKMNRSYLQMLSKSN